MSAKEGVNIKKYELVPPDGGWGYIIWIAVIINLVATSSFVGCFGMIFNELFLQLDMGSTSITLLNGVNAMGVAISGFMAGPLLKFISMRQLGFVAALLMNLGSFGTIFVNSKIVFFLCYGVLQSLGIGLLVNISYSIINDYFVKRRLLSLSITQSVPAIAGLFSPQLVKVTLKWYGFRGALVLLLVINMQTFIAVSLMQPVARHFKKVEIPNDENAEMKLLIVENQSNPGTPMIKLSDKEIESNNTEKNDEKDLKLDLNTHKNKSIKTIIMEAIDLSLMRSFLLSSAGLGIAICTFADLNFVLMLPQTLYAANWTEDEVAWAISLNCLGDVITRILFIFCSTWLLRFENQQIYLVGLFMAAATRIGMLGSENVTAILVFLTFVGSARCMIFLLIPLVIADAVRPEQFTSAMGIFMLAYGFSNLILGPIIGAVRDLTDSYPTAMYIITSCFGVVIIFWVVEICYKKNKHKRKPKLHTSGKR